MIALLLKTHVSGYTRQDGTYVAAHEDRRAHHQPASFDVREEAEKIAESLRRRGVDGVEIQHSGSAAGKSSYIKVPHLSKEIRVSDHSKGVFNSQFYLPVFDAASAAAVMKELDHHFGGELTPEQLAAHQERLSAQAAAEEKTQADGRNARRDAALALAERQKRGEELTGKERREIKWYEHEVAAGRLAKAHPAIRTMIGGDPTPAQAASGRYPKERMAWQGLTIAIEHPEGTVREGVDETGKAWRTVFRFAYGEILGTTGLDGDPVDVFIGSYPDAPEVYIVQQMRRKRWDEPDEQKCMINFGSIDEAKAAYLGHYDDPRFFGGITAMPVAEFVAKVRATRKEPKMIKSQQPVVLFSKSHIGAYTKKDGTFVAAHEDKRPAQIKRTSNLKLKPAGEKTGLITEPGISAILGERVPVLVRPGSAGDGMNFSIDTNGQAILTVAPALVADKDFLRYRFFRAVHDFLWPYSDDMYVRAHDDQADYDHLISGDHKGSKNHATGEDEGGLSVARRTEAGYSHSYLVSGNKIGQGSDSEPLLDVSTVKVHSKRMDSRKFHDKLEKDTIKRFSSMGIDEKKLRALKTQAYLKFEHPQISITKAAVPVVLLLKGRVGPYLRGGRIVNVAGYQGRAARGKPSEGQMSLFADSAPAEKKEHTSSNLSNNSPIESKRENVMHYHGSDDQISTSDVSWETAKGEVKITLIRNAELGVNGWMRSAAHKIQLKLGGESVSYYGDAQDPEHGFVLKANMGRITVRVPADKAEAVRALLREREENNDAASRAAYQAEAESRQRRRGVNDMMTAGGRSY